jgi:hypothetical protein
VSIVITVSFAATSRLLSKNAVSVDIRQRDAKDIQVFPCNPTTDAKNGALFNRESIDLQVMVAWPVAHMPDWQTGRQRNPLKCR